MTYVRPSPAPTAAMTITAAQVELAMGQRMTEQQLTEQQLTERARRRVSDIVAFAIHAIVYVAVNVGIWLIDIAEGGGVEWAYWTTIPWGIGVAIHGIVLVLELRVFSEEWRDRRVRNYVSRRRTDTDDS